MLRYKEICVISLALCIAGCGDTDSSQSKAMLNEDLKCPEGSKGEYAPWGGIDSPGWAHSCKMNHGKYHVWKGDVLVIEGQYNQGKKDGLWIIRNDNGKTTKTVTYINGEELKN
ncbi:MAG: hypothetical protein ABW116_13565 [Candidatus Sedimenticola sp. 20ELBAFRAG]